MIADSVDYLKKHDLEVIYDAEHFFDGYRDNPHYAMQSIKAAVEAGADFICLCDTNGGTMPGELAATVRAVREKIDTPLGIHTHNDCECAVANTLIAVDEGAVMVQGTINGYGERCGNANLISIIPALVLKKGVKVVDDERLTHLTELSHYVAEICNINPDAHQPYVGQNAFAHKGGIHVSGVSRRSDTYEHVPPEAVGNLQRVKVSELSGKSTIIIKAPNWARTCPSTPTRCRRSWTR